MDFAQFTMPQYQTGPVHRFMAGQLESVERGDVARLMLFLPPRTGKTELLLRFVAWTLGRNPDWQVLYTSYGADLAWEKSGEARAVVDSEEFGQVFGAAGRRSQVIELDPTSRAVQRWRIRGHRGGVTAQGVGGPITGKGGRLVIIDDPVKNREEADSATMREKTFRWYTSTLRTRLEPRGAIICVMTRWHDDDLAGRLLAQAARDPLADQWTVVSLPAVATEADALGRQPGQALDPIRFDEAALAATRATIGPRDWSALYQQAPMPDGGSVFQAAWFGRADAPERRLASQVIQAWDTAFKAGQENDYSACVTLGKFKNEIHVLNVWRGRVGFPELLAQMRRQHELFQPNVIVVEDKGSGTSALQELRSTSLPVVAVQAERDKVARANMITGMCEAGKVSVPSTWWGDDLLDELIRFPAGAHDDQVDALVYGLMRLRSKGVRIGWA